MTYVLLTPVSLPVSWPTMERCPTELWVKIAALACTDGGYTGRSLSLVSRTMRDTVKFVRLYSVSLVGEDHLLAFSLLLSGLEPSPLIRHLFIELGTDDHAPYAPTLERALELQNAFNSILIAAAPHLHTLFVQGGLGRFNPIGDSFEYPVLRDLSISQFCMRANQNTPPHIPFPSLRRLHATTCLSLLDFWPNLVRLAPNVSHVRLSGVVQSLTICPFLHILFANPTPSAAPGDLGDGYRYPPESKEAAEALIIALRLPGLKRIFLQSLKFQNSGWCETGAVVHSKMMLGLQKMARATAQSEGPRRLFLLPDSLSYEHDEAHKHWLDLVEGGDGPWQEGLAEWGGDCPGHIQFADALPGGLSAKARRRHTLPASLPTSQSPTASPSVSTSQQRQCNSY